MAQIERYVKVLDELPTNPKRGQICFLTSSVDADTNGMYVCIEAGVWDKVVLSIRPAA